MSFGYVFGKPVKVIVTAFLPAFEVPRTATIMPPGPTPEALVNLSSSTFTNSVLPSTVTSQGCGVLKVPFFEPDSTWSLQLVIRSVSLKSTARRSPSSVTTAKTFSPIWVLT